MTNQIDQQAAAATAQLEQMKEAYARSPDQVAARARAQLAELESDPHRLGRGASAERDRSILQSQINVAEAEALRATEGLTEAQRIDAAVAGTLEVPQSEMTTPTVLPTRDLIGVVDGWRELGIGDRAIRETLDGTMASAFEHAWAERHMAERLSDGEWAKRYLAGGRAERRVMELLSMMVNAPVDPNRKLSAEAVAFLNGIKL